MVRTMDESDRIFGGGCHCGAIRVYFAPELAPDALPLHRCGCSFCRRHAATTATDPRGRLHIEIRDPEEAVRYRFGARTADFLLCGRCGVFVAAVMTSEAGSVATLNVHVLDERSAFTAVPTAVDYSDESAQERRLRRAHAWTLTTIEVSSHS
jgi:hypothetical protein